MIKYLLDTNICIYVIKNRPLEVLSKFNDSAGRMAISSITLAELLHGCEKSQKVEHNTRQVEDFCSRLEVLEYGNNAAQHYGSIRANLEKSGQMIGVNDLHIAGHARSLGLTVVTNNEREFHRVKGLLVENWIS
ncbi:MULTISPECIES: type II toxin-antitoxin system tRNA(fMet)-specific endonuclease VapC [Alteromonas]|uniref:type II toxin-antitoxin system tRNA(fMet)-specific endonuclease VapC n=1 Tax=Alteromonas portus TaxID=2565549 RepID=UPI0022B99D2C|nr:type II toxin-antitoxin system VapC family toxin [Alteromonas sp. PRIM-21]MCZ8531619.1 type II toxin-antitoxin system VapC family toxin [Alteromonas sp. PRIM-21]|tara:strand:+ start:413 stop:814 length:402 start_codon:yes stop_codon:yes gene_type:complete